MFLKNYNQAKVNNLTTTLFGNLLNYAILTEVKKKIKTEKSSVFSKNFSRFIL